jgi:hypothetical protein
VGDKGSHGRYHGKKVTGEVAAAVKLHGALDLCVGFRVWGWGLGLERGR